MSEDPGTRLDRDAQTIEPEAAPQRDERLETPDDTSPTQHPYETPETPDNTRSDRG